jgi:hypothetical protein
VLSAILSGLALLVRLNSVSVPVALVLWWWFGRNRKHAVLFSCVWAVIVVPTLVAFNAQSNGFLLLNLTGSKFGRFALTYIHDLALRMFSGPGLGFAVVLFALGAFSWLELRNDADRRVKLLRIYVLVSCFVAVFGSAAAGANVNHYLEFAFASAVLIPSGLARLERAWVNDSPVTALVAVLLALLLVPSLDILRSKLVHEKGENYRSAAQFIGSRSTFTDIPYVAARTSPPQLVDLGSLINAEKSGRHDWSSVSVLNGLRNGKYEFVILSLPVDQIPVIHGLYPRHPRLTAEMQSAIRQHYRLCQQSGDAYIYRPLGSSAEREQPARTGSSCE